MTDWKAKYVESELARARAVEALKALYAEAEKGDGTTVECTMAYMADDAISAQPPNDVAETLRRLEFFLKTTKENALAGGRLNGSTDLFVSALALDADTALKNLQTLMGDA